MKYYAVKAGHTPGVYSSWPECQKQVNGYSCAVYKSFQTLKEAQDFIRIEEKEEKNKVYHYTVFTDGSADLSKNLSGGSAYFVNEKKVVYGRNPGDGTNNRGELYGVYLAFKTLNEMKLEGKSVLIMIDSEYARRVITGEWKAKTNLDILDMCRKELTKLKNTKNTIDFDHVYGHTGVNGNEIADHYAGLSYLNPDNYISQLI